MQRKSSESAVAVTHDSRAIARHGVPTPVSAADVASDLNTETWMEELTQSMQRLNNWAANVDFSADLAEGREARRSGKLDPHAWGEALERGLAHWTTVHQQGAKREQQATWASSSCCPSAGSSNEPSVGWAAVAAWLKIGSASTATHWRSCAGPPSA
jgi:hypothetical protein